jgi:hypothetical protein
MLRFIRAEIKDRGVERERDLEEGLRQNVNEHCTILFLSRPFLT